MERSAEAQRGAGEPGRVVAWAPPRAGALEGVATASDALGPMQASLIRAFAAKMREENRDAFERAVEGVGGGSDEASFGGSDAAFGGSDEAFGGSDEASRRGDDATVEWDAVAMAGAARRAGMDLARGAEDSERDDEWGPEDLSELEGLTEEEIEARLRGESRS